MPFFFVLRILSSLPLQLFDMYLAMKEDHCSAVHRQEQVRQMARQLRKLERVKAARLKRERLTADSAPDTNESGASDVEMRAHTPNKGDHKKSKHVKLSDCVRTPSTKSRQESFGSESAEGTVLYPLVISTASMIVGSTTVLAPILHVPSSGEHPPAAVTRFGEHERRGALPMGRKALHELEHGQSRNPDTVCLVSGPVVSKPPNAEQNSVRSSSDVRGKSKIDS